LWVRPDEIRDSPLRTFKRGPREEVVAWETVFPVKKGNFWEKKDMRTKQKGGLCGRERSFSDKKNFYRGARKNPFNLVKKKKFVSHQQPDFCQKEEKKGGPKKEGYEKEKVGKERRAKKGG